MKTFLFFIFGNNASLFFALEVDNNFLKTFSTCTICQLFQILLIIVVDGFANIISIFAKNIRLIREFLNYKNLNYSTFRLED